MLKFLTYPYPIERLLRFLRLESYWYRQYKAVVKELADTQANTLPPTVWLALDDDRKPIGVYPSKEAGTRDRPGAVVDGPWFVRPADHRNTR
jgi:hypothetical protein